MLFLKGIKRNMTKRILALWFVVSAVFVISGCDPDGEGIPRIIGNVGYTVLQPVGILLPKSNSAPKVTKSFERIPSLWYPLKRYEKGWKAIVIHHSATTEGNAAVFHNWHKNGHNWKGIGYDFVIGNGKGSGEGRVEVTFRWRRQITGAHVGGTPKNWANADAVGICLVGDFSKAAPSSRQMRSLAKLVRFLQKRYNIPDSRIYGHNDTPGYKGATACPGKKFSLDKLKQIL